MSGEPFDITKHLVCMPNEIFGADRIANATQGISGGMKYTGMLASQQLGGVENSGKAVSTIG